MQKLADKHRSPKVVNFLDSVIATLLDHKLGPFESHIWVAPPGTAYYLDEVGTDTENLDHLATPFAEAFDLKVSRRYLGQGAAHGVDFSHCAKHYSGSAKRDVARASKLLAIGQDATWDNTWKTSMQDARCHMCWWALRLGPRN